jgi:TolB-like protein/DNA-binding winged helix-turn-helix (wHTH) protein
MEQKYFFHWAAMSWPNTRRRKASGSKQTTAHCCRSVARPTPEVARSDQLSAGRDRQHFDNLAAANSDQLIHHVDDDAHVVGDHAHNVTDLGAYSVDPKTGEVSDGEQAVRLQPQAIEVLRYLAMRPGQVVSRHEIEDAVWSDRTVGYDALTGTMFKLRKALGDYPKAPTMIETISKRGYRLLVQHEPVAVATLQSSGGSTRLLPQEAVMKLLTRPVLSGAAVLLVAVVMIAGRYASVRHGLEAPIVSPRSGRAIVVLPFHNLAGAESDSIVANGLTEDLTTALAKVPELTVIARDSAVVYKGEQASLSELAQRLKVNFVLRGSVRHKGDQVRLNIQLIDVSSGKYIWVEQLDGRLSGIFDLQDHIVGQLISTLTDGSGSNGVQKQLVARTTSTKAYRAFQLGRQHFYLYINKRKNAKARELFATALQHDPHFAMAQVMLA